MMMEGIAAMIDAGDQVATEAELSAIDAELLVAVDRGARRITDVAEAAGTSISAASRHVDHLVELGWVSRGVDPTTAVRRWSPCCPMVEHVSSACAPPAIGLSPRSWTVSARPTPGS